jgi:hypothetical protein
MSLISIAAGRLLVAGVFLAPCRTGLAPWRPCLQSWLPATGAGVVPIAGAGRST